MGIDCQCTQRNDIQLFDGIGASKTKKKATLSKRTYLAYVSKKSYPKVKSVRVVLTA